MTNTIDTTLTSVMFSPAGQSENNLLNQRHSQRHSKGLDARPSGQENIPLPSLLAGQIVSNINRASNLSPTFKREAVMLTALVDGVAPSNKTQEALGAVAAGVNRQSQRAAAQGVQAQPPLIDPQNLFDQTRQVVLNPAAEQQGGDVVSLSPGARARLLGEGFNDPQMVDMVRNLGSEAVASIFGEPPGVRDPEQSRLPESARLAAPQEIREERAALRKSILQRITGGKLPE